MIGMTLKNSCKITSPFLIRKPHDLRVRSFDPARDPSYLCEKPFVCNGFRRELDRWSLGFVTPSEDAENFMIERGVLGLIEDEALLKRYGFVKSEDFNLDTQLRNFRNMAVEGKWQLGKARAFKFHAWWYELSEEGKRESEICDLIAKRFPLLVDYGALKFMREEHKKDFERLCAKAGVESASDEKTLGYLLAVLRRLKIVKAKANSVEVPVTSFQFHPQEKNFHKSHRYIVPLDFPSDLMPRYFDDVELPAVKNECHEDYGRAMAGYLKTGTSSALGSRIRSAIHRMKKRILNVKPL